MAKKDVASSEEKQFILFNRYNSPEMSGTLKEIACYLASEEDDDNDQISSYKLYELGKELKFEYYSPDINITK